jgi:hypothetical protein
LNGFQLYKVYTYINCGYKYGKDEVLLAQEYSTIDSMQIFTKEKKRKHVYILHNTLRSADVMSFFGKFFFFESSIR